MTVQDNPNTIDYTGNGSQTSFAFTFRVDDVSWVDINFLDDFDQVLLNADQDTSPGGSVEYTVAPPNLQLVRITRITPQDQDLDYTRYDPFDSESHEDALDKLTMIAQDLQTLIDGISSTTLPVGTIEGSTLRWDNTGLDWDEFITYIFPAADGAPGEALVTDGAGNLSFASASADPLLLGDGSILNPTYSFSADPDTGFYRVASGRIGVSLNNNAQFEFNTFNSGTFRGATAGAAGIRDIAATGPGPTVHPNADDTNTGLGYPGNDEISVVAGGQMALQFAEANVQVLQTNHAHTGLTASTTQTQGQGGLFSSYNEVATVANPNDTVTAPSVGEGRRLVIINNGANTLQVFPASGDNLGAGVDSSITIAAGAALVAIGRGGVNWDVLQNFASSGPGAVRGAKAFHSVNQSIVGTGADVVVALNSEAYDTDTVHDNVTNNSRLTIPAGVTRIRLKASVHWQANASSYRTLKIRKGGADGAIDDDQATFQPWCEMTANIGPNSWDQQCDSGVIRGVSGDYFEMVVAQNSGVALNLLANRCFFEMEIIE